MADQFHSVQHITSADVSRVSGLLQHHPETSMAAILALAFPGERASTTGRPPFQVGSVHDDSEGVVRVALQWEVPLGSAGFAGFHGELRATPQVDGASLTLEGVVYGRAGEAAALGRVLSWLAFAAEVEASPGDT